MSKDKLLIMGANSETIGLVEKAKEMGFYTIVTDYNHNAPAKKISDLALDIDGFDSNTIVSYAKDNGVNSVLLGVAEVLIPSYIRVCKEIGKKPYINEYNAKLFLNKNLFKETCRRYDVPVVDEYCLDAPEKIKYPVVVKPIDANSSKGITICTNYDELITGVRNAKKYSRSGDIIIEKYMTGDEVVIYYIIQNGNPILVGMCDRYTNKEQKGVAQLPTSYIFPSKYLQNYEKNINPKVVHMFKSLGLENGTLFIQSFVENGETKFYEPGYRFAGAQEHYIIGAATGLDTKELMINFAVTNNMSENDLSLVADPYLNGKFGCKLSPLIRTGHIGRIIGLEKIAKHSDVVHVSPHYYDGDIVDGVGTLNQVACRFFVVSNSIGDLKAAIDYIQNTFDVIDEKGNSMKLEDFDTETLYDYE